MGHHGPKQTEDSDIERTPEYAAFMQDLIEYHMQRGTHLQKEPALGPRRISLLKLYNKIISYGGYDQVSETSLMWRRLAEEYNVPPMSNAGMPGYLLKSMYYKNLCAYEIEKHWGRKAPPPELLEHLTARGGAILSRPEIVNPSPAKSAAAQSPAAQPRTIRPPPLPKQPQHVAVQLVVPPMPPVTLSTEYVRPVPETEFVRPLYPITAGHFGSSTLHDAATNHLQPLISRSFIDQHKPEEEPDARITVRALYRAGMSLKSGIESEMNWAVRLLIKASYELADDFILEKVSNLPEILLQVLDEGVSAMSAEVADNDTSTNDLNGDVEERSIKRIKLHNLHFQSSNLLQHSRALEVALVLRNATLQQENARYIAQLPVSASILRKALLLPDEGRHLEMKQYCMDICDAIVPGLQISSEEDSLYLAFVELLKSDERDSLLLGLRSLSRLSVADEHNRLLQDISAVVISKLVRLLQLEDVELLHALAGFFFQYTTYQSNTASLSRVAELPTLLKRLVGLTMWNAQKRIEHLQITDAKTITKDLPPPPATPPKLSDEIVRDLLTFQEPERAIHWMRACFEEDASQSVTQILLWQSYRTLFTPYSQAQQNGSTTVSGKPLLQAADVIKMVGNAFNGATAMVLSHPTEGQKFLIRGIRCREYPLAPSGKKYATCQWITDSETKAVCAAPFANQKDLHAHVMDKHVKSSAEPVSCKWSGCSRFAPDGITDHRQFAIHLRLHTSNLFPAQVTSRTIQGTQISIQNEYTQQDDKGEPKGIALTAALTLRNILCSDSQILSDDVSMAELKHDLLSHLTLNPVVAARAGEVLAAL